jgi:hypothetical protein
MALLQKGYLGATPLFRQQDWFQDKFALLERSSATTLTADTSAHTKGAWSQVIATTTSNASLIAIRVSGVHSGNTNTATLLDIGTGAASSETAVASNIAIAGASTASLAPVGIIIPIPLKIPSGTRLSARIQSVVTGGKQATVEIFLFDAGDYATAPTSVDVLGTNTATSAGTALSGSANTWVEVVASTAQAYRAISFVPCMVGNTSSSLGVEYEIGVGASSSEQAFLFSTARFSSEETCNSAGPNFPIASLSPVALPAGSRLAVRHNLSANSGRHGFTLIGIP